MAPEKVQILIDADEADTAARYQRRRDFLALVDEAVRRADAMQRLEVSLRMIAIR